jgi:hypothetical protein
MENCDLFMMKEAYVESAHQFLGYMANQQPELISFTVGVVEKPEKISVLYSQHLD